MKTILHVDMDAFFASVEMREHPEWRDRPVIVGSGPHERGVVSTCNYAARRYGVHSAMPSRTAYARCPTAVFVRPHMDLYQQTSERAFEVFAHYSPYVEGVSIDEAFLDITGSIHLFGSSRALGEALRAEIRSVCGVTCSVGIATNRLLAKLGSEEHKPDGLTLMPDAPDEIAAFLAPKTLGVLWGIGPKTAALLAPYGLKTCGDLQRLGAERLAAIVGDETARHLVDHAFGRADDTVYWQSASEQSVSREYTFPDDEHDREAIRAKLLELVEEVGVRFRREKRWARTARLKLRDTSFNTITRQMPFDAPARDDIALRTAALALFERERTDGVRLIGFGVTNIQETPDDTAQGELFASPDETRRKRNERLSEALDNLRERGLL